MRYHDTNARPDSNAELTERGRNSRINTEQKEGVVAMKEELTDNKRNSILLPFLVGGIVGAGVALLLAPKPGKEVREDIKRFAANTKDNVTSVIDKGKTLFDESKTVVSNAIEAGKAAYEQEKEKMRHAA